jgi:hypothetical protein
MKKSEFKALVQEVLKENHWAMHHPEEDDKDTSTNLGEPKSPEEILLAALKEIAAYDKTSKYGEGICDYGCDAPYVAQMALANYKKAKSGK